MQFKYSVLSICKYIPPLFDIIDYQIEGFTIYFLTNNVVEFEMILVRFYENTKIMNL